MKLFTFSGIRGGLFGTNSGAGLVDFANEIISELPKSRQPEYTGTTGVDHFPSAVSLGTIIANHEAILSLNGAPELDSEARLNADLHASKILEALEGDPDPEVLVVAHSQGTNNAAWALREMLDKGLLPSKRVFRIAMFDAKVSPTVVDELFRRAENFRFFFFQSENDVLGNQNLQRKKFSDAFPHGDHLWVKGLNHGSIVTEKAMRKKQQMLRLKAYLQFQRDYEKKRISINVSPHDPSPVGTKMSRLRTFVKKYPPSLTDVPMLAITGFLEGKLPKKFQS